MRAGKNTVLNKLWLIFIIITGLSINANSSLTKSSNVFLLEGNQIQSTKINRYFSHRGELNGQNITLGLNQIIFGAGINADIKFFGDASLIRIILIDDQSEEYLLYEVYSLIADNYTFSINNACLETKILNAVTPVSLQIQLSDASISIRELTFIPSRPYTENKIHDYINQVREEQHKQKIDLLNLQIKKKGMNWTAGSTSLSSSTYSEKKCMFGGKKGMLGNLQGFEYCIDGTFELKSNMPETAIKVDELVTSAMVDSFDWRARHGANNPNSPYYDGDEDGGGWATSIKDQSYPQRCGSCWTFATIGTAEMMVNLYYNRHLDIDLSEQYLMTCSCPITCEKNGKPCDGGWATLAAKWLVDSGVTDEGNFPYEASDGPACGDSAENPKEHLYFADYLPRKNIPSDDSLKQFLIHYGPLNVEIISMWHCMPLVGYNNEGGQTVWIFKNSHGKKQEYMFLKLKLNDLRSVDAFIPPVISKVYNDDSIRCVDLDGDGYYNWGIGTKPATCPEGCPDEEDCDDFRKDLGPMATDGSCEEITTGIKIKSLQNSKITCYYVQNPFSKFTVIKFKSTDNSKAKVQIYDLFGKLINTLTVQNVMDGFSKVVWDRTNESGKSIYNGIYICKVDIDNQNTRSTNYFKIIVSR